MLAADADAYLSRMNYDGPLNADAESLRQLQLAHLYHVPFENLSIHNDEPIILDEALLYKKVVGRRRGGFCYELNGLFAALLTALGYRVTKLAAQVWREGGHYTPPFSHLMLQVDLAEPWLVDVGFGTSFLEPLRLNSRQPQMQANGSHRLEQEGEFLVFSAKYNGEAWRPQYRFRLEPHQLHEYEEMCRFYQYDPSSHFRQGRVTTKATPDGRVTLSELRYITTTNGGARTEKILPDEAAYQACLAAEFGIQLHKHAS